MSRHPDVPVTLNLRWNPDALRKPHRRSGMAAAGGMAGSGGERGSHGQCRRSLPGARDGPLDLDNLLASQPGVRVNEGPRVVCIELLPAGATRPHASTAPR